MNEIRKPALPRRSFLQGAAAALAMPGLIGCSNKSGGVRPLGEIMREVAAQHREYGPLPPNPVAVAWDPSVNTYPSIHDPMSFHQSVSEVYGLTARALMMLNPENPENPLSNLIRPGDVVTVKPNWCTQYKFPFPITHPSVVFPIVEFALKAGASKVKIVESAFTISRVGCEFFWTPNFVGAYRLAEVLSELNGGADVSFTDGNNDDWVWIDLDDYSELSPIEMARLDHDGHNGFEKNMFFDVEDCRGFNPKRYKQGRYAIAKSYLDSDVFINVPKLKTHIITGITIALKNMMGLNIRSTIHRMPPDVLKHYESLPDYAQYRESPYRDVPHYDRSTVGTVDKPWESPEGRFHSGPGNDILWRTLADLNKIIHYAGVDGKVYPTPQRRYLNVVDAIVGTDRGGPISDSIVYSNCIVAGADPVGVDAACALLMGWNPEVLNLVKNSSEIAALNFGKSGEIHKRIVGVDRGADCFKQRYIPPTTYDDPRLNLFVS